MFTRFGFALCVLLAAGAYAGAEVELLRDGSFDGEPEGVWEIRYLDKPSTEGLPTWTVAVRDGKRPHGRYLGIDEDDNAAGTVLIGQRVRLPAKTPPLKAAFDYQTYCAAEDRSGMIDVRAYTVEAWDSLPTAPKFADAPDALFSQQLVRQGKDVTTWAHQEAILSNSHLALAPYAGQEIVLCLGWSTWHEGTEEWARFDNVSISVVQLLAEPIGWPASLYSGRIFALVADVVAAGAEPRVTLEIRRAGDTEWRALPMRRSGQAGEGVPGTRYVGLVEPQEPGRVQCRLSAEAGERKLTTRPHTIRVKQEAPVHPHLFYSPDEIEAMKRRIAKYPWAAEIFAGARRNADAWLQRTDHPPQEGGGWSHDYYCQECGARLRFDENRPHEHFCPTCEEYRTGEKLDRVWISTIHGRFANAAADLGLAYAITGEEKYARRGAEILLDYARLYPALPLNRGPAGRGRIMAQSLSECTWLLRVMRAYDLLYNALTDEERAVIENEFIRPDTYDRFPYTFRIHNIQCWHNACYAAAGYLLGDDLLIEKSLEGQYGFYEQVKQGILDDGMWYERSLGYHNYTLSALTTHCEVARHNGLDLYKDEKIKRMFLLPMRMSQPNLVPPSLSDQGYSTRRIGTDQIERALGWYGDREFAGVLAYLYAAGAKRTSRAALDYGEELPSEAPAPGVASANLTGTGAAILRDGAGDDARWVLLRYGEHGGGHGHPDKLEIILYGLGRTLMPDLGNPGYGTALHRGYYKTTPGHNTVTLGGATQARTAGECLAFGGEGPIQAAVAESRGAYEDAVLRRTVVLGPGYLADIFRVEAPEQTTIDYILRCAGELTVTPSGQAADGMLGEQPGYRYMEVVRRISPDANGSWQATWALPEPEGARVHLTGIGAEGCEIIQVSAPGIPGRERMGTLVLRRDGDAATFVVVQQLLTAGVEPLPVRPVLGGIAVGQAVERSVVLSPDLAGMRGERIGEPGRDLQVLTVRNGRVADAVTIEIGR